MQKRQAALAALLRTVTEMSYMCAPATFRKKLESKMTSGKKVNWTHAVKSERERRRRSRNGSSDAKYGHAPYIAKKGRKKSAGRDPADVKSSNFYTPQASRWNQAYPPDPTSGV